VRPFLLKHPIDYTVALGTDATAKQYNLDSYPVTVVFDRAGEEVRRFNESLTEPELLGRSIKGCALESPCGRWKRGVRSQKPECTAGDSDFPLLTSLFLLPTF
jgi:hypothetical protein